MLKHLHALNTRSTVVVSETGDRHSVCVIETDLALSPRDPAFDQAAFRDLELAAQQYLESHPNYEEFRIRAVRKV